MVVIANLKKQNFHPGVTVRAIILGLLLIPVNTYFIMANHLKFWSTLPTTMSLIYNVIITLMVLIPFNLLLNRFLPRFALRQGELLTVFVMLSLSSAIAGHDMMQTVIPTISDGYWFATPENEWKQLFWRYLPPWLTSNNEASLQAFYDGEGTVYHKSAPTGLATSDPLVDNFSDRSHLGDDLYRCFPPKTVDRARTVDVSYCAIAVGNDEAWRTTF